MDMCSAGVGGGGLCREAAEGADGYRCDEPHDTGERPG